MGTPVGDPIDPPSGRRNTPTQFGHHNTQVNNFMVPLAGTTGRWTRAGHLQQVREIAPDGGAPGGLKDREAEIAELVEFCAGDEPYLWWRAGPWAGKTALMAHFVLNPPADVDVVWFFVNATVASRSDSDAFTNTLLEQLGALLGENQPPGADRDALRRTWLTAAAAKARAEGRRLVLVVDGLDEDRGSHAGSDRPSIASLLPRNPGDDLRIVVTSRPNPRLPDDVGDDHPLRSHLRPLSPSRHAAEVGRRARSELAGLLRDTGAGREVISYITASGGGLSVGELEDLTELPRYELLYLLDGVFGRTVADRTDHLGERAYRACQFTHETLHKTAVEHLGGSVLRYRERLHVWADRYRERGWPSDTPPYLLQGYARLLDTAGEAVRLVRLATDHARHQRLLHVTGGDAAALAEIASAFDLVLAAAEPDLVAIARLSVHRSGLAERNTFLPRSLPAVWATLGQPDRAEALASAIGDPNLKAEALAGVAEAVALTGDHERAVRIAAAVVEPDRRVHALATVAAAVGARDPERARLMLLQAGELADSVTDPERQAQAVATVAASMAAAGDFARAERIAAALAEPDHRALASAAVAAQAAAAGDIVRADRLLAGVEDVARDIADVGHRVRVQTRAAETAVAAGRIACATRLIAAAETAALGVDDPYRREWAFSWVAEAAAAAGDHRRTQRIMEAVADPVRRAHVLSRTAEARAYAGDGHGAKESIAAAERIAGSVTDPTRRDAALLRVAEAAATAGLLDHAERIGRAVATAEVEGDAWAGPIRATAVAGGVAAATGVAEQITSATARAQALTVVAEMAAEAGDHELARTLLASAEQVARTVTAPERYLQGMTTLAHVASAAGDLELAERVAGAIADPAPRTVVLFELTTAAVRSGDVDRAVRIAAGVTDPEQRDRTMNAVAELVAPTGDFARTAQLARLIGDPARRAQVLTTAAEQALAAGDRDGAGDLLNEAEAAIRLPRDGLAAKDPTAGPERAGDKTRLVLASEHRRTALNKLALAALRYGDLERVERVTDIIVEPEHRASILTSSVLMALDLNAEVERLLEAAEEAIREIPEIDGPRNDLAVNLSYAAEAVGDFTRAARIIRLNTAPDRQPEVLARLARAAVTADSPEEAERIAASIADPARRSPALTSMVDAAGVAGGASPAEDPVNPTGSRTGGVMDADPRILRPFVDLALAADDPDEAELLARQILESVRPDRPAGVDTAGMDRADVLIAAAERTAQDLPDRQQRVWVLTTLVWMIARTGSPTGADRAITLAEGIIRTIAVPEDRVHALIELALTADRAGRRNRISALMAAAERDAGIVSDVSHRSWAFRLIAGLAARVQDQDNASRSFAAAERTARRIVDPREQARALRSLSDALSTAGQFDEAYRIARGITDLDRQSRALFALAEDAITSRDHERAERIAGAITDVTRRAKILTTLAELAAVEGRDDRAEQLASAIADPLLRAWAMVALVRRAGSAGNPALVAHLAAVTGRVIGAVPDPKRRLQASVALAQVIASTDVDHAERIARDINDPVRQARVLIAVAQVSPARAAHLCGRALSIAGWPEVLPDIVKIQPDLVRLIVEEYLALR